MVMVIEGEGQRAKEKFNVKEKFILGIIERKENRIKKINEDIADLLKKNDLNLEDLAKYKLDKKRNEVRGLQFPNK